MARINYTQRVKRFGTSSSMYCKYCRMQSYYHVDMMKGNKLEVPEEKLLNKPFFGIEFGQGKGNAGGNRPKDIAFQKDMYKALISHSRDAHPQNITNMISLGWIKK